VDKQKFAIPIAVIFLERETEHQLHELNADD
jgi:hypothetical protein